MSRMPPSGLRLIQSAGLRFDRSASPSSIPRHGAAGVETRGSAREINYTNCNSIFSDSRVLEVTPFSVV